MKNSNILDSLTATKCFTINDLKKGQQSKHWIVQKKNIVTENAISTLTEKKKKAADVQKLLKEQSKLSINENNLLSRKSTAYHEIIYPYRYKEAV